MKEAQVRTGQADSNNEEGLIAPATQEGHQLLHAVGLHNQLLVQLAVDRTQAKFQREQRKEWRVSSHEAEAGAEEHFVALAEHAVPHAKHRLQHTAITRTTTMRH
jgi:hypothetical protein